MGWTTPRTWVANETVTAAQMNTHVRDNVAYLYEAKFGLFGRLAALTVPNAAWTSIEWDFDVEQEPTMWPQGSYEERIAPPLAGIWLVNVLIRWEPSTASGSRSVRLQKNGTDLIGQDKQTIANGRQHLSVTAAVRLAGSSDYVNVHVYQDGGADDTLLYAVERTISLTWMGA